VKVFHQLETYTHVLNLIVSALQLTSNNSDILCTERHDCNRQLSTAEVDLGWGR